MRLYTVIPGCLLALLIGTASCSLFSLLKGDTASHWKPPHPVTIKGCKMGINYSLNTWAVEPEKEGPLALLVREGDILFVNFSEEYFFPYLTSDGTSLSVSHDDYGLFLGGKRIMAQLPAGEAALAWLSRAGPGDYDFLRVCVFKDPDEERDISAQAVLKRLSEINPEMGWVVNKVDTLRDVLDLFDPWWLMITDDIPLDEEVLTLISNEPALAYLYFSAKELKSLKSLTCPKKLRAMSMRNWDPKETGPLHGEWKSLQSLTLWGSSMTDLSGIPRLETLHELHFISSRDLSDIKALSGFSSLEAVNLTDCKKVTDLSVLKGLKGLKWLCLPPNTSQKQFDGIIRDHPDLRVLELIGCENIRDLSPLRSLGRLESLVLLDGVTDYAPVGELKGLRFLALSGKAFEEAAGAKDLHKALPQCLIVQAEPFCLGSGWILLLWPSVPLLWFLADRLLKTGRRIEKR